MNLEHTLSQAVSEAIHSLYNAGVPANQIIFSKTDIHHRGDLTLVVFPFLKVSKKSPEQTAGEIGNYLKEHCAEVAEVNAVKGFLNITVSGEAWLKIFSGIYTEKNYGTAKADSANKTVMLEYCSPNTNKPLHLGHVRNILLGWSISQILEANGVKVIKTNLVNDRGIHICKSMLAWKKWGEGKTPQSQQKKGDHFVGEYYVEFDRQLKLQTEDGEEKEKDAPLFTEAQEMLRKWEAGDKETISLWKQMNNWVYEGFNETYKALGVSFDKIYYESETYLLGKKIIDEGLKNNVFQKNPDGSVFIDLTKEGLEKKILLRSDGTSVYITQDMGTALERMEEYRMDQLIYVVGNEQDYHFKILFTILNKLGYPWAKSLYHLSYGMVDLPEGKMKSREGTVVDADDLIAEMISEAEKVSQELGKIEEMREEEKKNLYRVIGLAALKYFILKVDPKKRMLFNPAESIDFNGNTGPFIQYTYARIRSVLRKAKDTGVNYELPDANHQMLEQERTVVKWLYDFPGAVREAGERLSPAAIANYSYELATAYNRFYHDITILKEENTDLRNFRLALSEKTALVIKTCMHLLGIEVPERM